MPRKVDVTVSLNPALKAWLDQRVAAGEYADAAEGIEQALRRAKSVASSDDVRVRALEGLRSGPARSLTSRDWSRYRAEVRRRDVERRQRRKSA